MLFEEITQTYCYHYVLESFTETRSTTDAIDSSNGSSSFARSRTGDNLANSTIEACHSKILATTVIEGSVEGGRGAAQTTTSIGNVEVKAVFSNDFGLNPWDFDVQPDDDFVNQVSPLH